MEMITIQGIITKVFSDRYKVKIENEYLDCTARGLFKLKNSKPLVGDKVEIKNNQIEKILPRKNEFIRPPIANIDQMIIVVATANPKPDLLLLDKQLIMAIKNNVEPVICINKIDYDEKYDEIINVYENLGYQVITTAAKNKTGVEKLLLLLQNKTTAFAGNSGVGKSTLTNDILGHEVSEEGETSEKIERGKHTTKYVELFEATPNTFIADTPGFSTYEIQDISYKNLEDYYIEFEHYKSDCKYRGCSHTKEDECGVKNAVSKKKINQGRYDRYCELYEKLKGEKKW